MSTLLFLLYLADVTAALKAALGVIGGVAAVLTIVIGIIAALEDAFTTVWPYLRRAIVPIAFTIAVAVLLPSKQLLYIAAGVQAVNVTAEAVSQSALGSKALTALEQYLDQLIDESSD